MATVDQQLTLLAADPSSGREGTSLLGSIGRGLLNGASLGFADEIKDGLNKVVPSLVDNGDGLRAHEQQDAVDHPIASGLSNVVGAIAPTFIPGLGEATLGKIALQGAANEVGNSNETANPNATSLDILSDAAKGALASAVLGGLVKSSGYATRKIVDGAQGKPLLTTNPLTLSQSSNPVARFAGNYMLNNLTKENQDLARQYGNNVLQDYDNQVAQKLSSSPASTPGDQMGRNIISQNINSLRNQGGTNINNAYDANVLRNNIKQANDIKNYDYGDTQNKVFAHEIQGNQPYYNEDGTTSRAGDVYNEMVRQNDARPFLNNSNVVNFLNNTGDNQSKFYNTLNNTLRNEHLPDSKTQVDLAPLALGLLAGHSGIGLLGSLWNSNAIPNTINNMARRGLTQDINKGNVVDFANTNTPSRIFAGRVQSADAVQAFPQLEHDVKSEQDNNQTSLEDNLRSLGWSDDEIKKYLGK